MSLTAQFVVTLASLAGGYVALRIGVKRWQDWRDAAEFERRQTAMRAKYGDQRLVDLIVRGSVWRGETPEMVRDSLGAPGSVEQRVSATGAQEIWTYWFRRLTVVFEGGRVVAWTQR